ncbi:hypothetical protein ACOMICROBIO_EPCKBFOG_03961 [Vibrio sp. B1FLJ16]|nr:hypothetical protein ACOMICROBIO_EPCKBFOG_03961 [Vibrio sp. B1FLJ16]CAE6944671.1 hypothetical protein ACOMICROBIO_EPCKBFOG_03961 [Vibrio sp. B1FLJ16]
MSFIYLVQLKSESKDGHRRIVKDKSQIIKRYSHLSDYSVHKFLTKMLMILIFI